MSSRSRFSGNTAFGLVGVGLFAASLVVGYLVSTDTDQSAALAIGFVGFGIAWLVVAAGQIVTGYAWQNLADRNEGPHRTENPGRFWSSVALDVVVFAACCAFALYKYHPK